MQYTIEITDTFGGEANYSWVRRHSFDAPELSLYGYAKAKSHRRELVRKAKALAGWTGTRCKVAELGDTLEIRPYGACVVAFVTLNS